MAERHAHKPAPLELNSESVLSLLHTAIANLVGRVDAHNEGSCDQATVEDSEHPYCELDETEQDFVSVLWSLVQWKAYDEFVEKDSELHELMDPKFRRIAKHKHDCGQRMTGPAVVVESA